MKKAAEAALLLGNAAFPPTCAQIAKSGLSKGDHANRKDRTVDALKHWGIPMLVPLWPRPPLPGVAYEARIAEQPLREGSH